MTPKDLAVELGVSPKTIRGWLRLQYPRTDAEHATRWMLNSEQVEAVRARFVNTI